MKNLWRYARLSSFDRIDFKGFGRWLLAAFILEFISIRMSTSGMGNSSESYIGIMPFSLCVGIYAFVYNRLTNLPQFSKGMLFTAKQEIKISITLLVEFFLVLVALLMCISLLDIIMSGTFEIPYINFGKEIHDRAWSFFYDLFMASLLFPLGLISDKKKWYLSFGVIAIVMEAVSLFLINLIPGSNGFRTTGNMYEDAVKIPNYNLVVIVMGVVALISIIVSYRISQKLHAPKRYVSL